MRNEVIHGDCIEVMRELETNSVDSIVTDPPYGIALLGNEWDTMEPLMFQKWTQAWAEEALRVLKPGGHMVSFSATRTYHRMATGIEDAGWEIRDSGVWLYRSGMPKARMADGLIDEHLGVERTVVGTAMGVDYSKSRMGFSRLTAKDDGSTAKEYEVTEATSPEAIKWKGHAIALKPCIEPWVLARKPLDGTIPHNILKWGTGVLNIGDTSIVGYDGQDRWTPNAVTMQGDENLEVFRITGGQVADYMKAGAAERPSVDGVQHPSVKPLELMKYLVRLATPKGGVVLEPFAGTGSTLVAAEVQGFGYIGIEANEEYIPLIQDKLSKPAQITLI